jgi:Zn-dependent oligopeptidase
MNDPKTIAKYIHCLSILEENTALLYSNLSDGVENPLIKSLLLSISQDSSKHSTLLKGVADSISDSKEKLGDCGKNLGEVWSIVSNFLNEAKKKGKEKLSFRDLLPKLNALESSIGEEYYIFVQMKTLQLMVKEINQLYNINLESIKKVFESIIKDEEHHRELLATIKDLISDKPKKHDNTAKVKYQNPDSWISPLPPGTYD